MLVKSITMIINELLCYALHNVHSSAGDNVKRIMQTFYTIDEIISAKKSLWDACADTLGPYPERKSSDKRPANIPHMNDIMEGGIAAA